MFMYIYRPPAQNKQYFLENLSMIVDHYSSIYDNSIILGDFNMEPNSPILISFMQSLNLFNIIKSNTCFKGNGTCIDLILTNRNYCFKHSSTFETGLSDHHHLIYSMLKTTFKKGEPKFYEYRDYKKFGSAAFQTDLQSKLEEGPKVYQNFEETFVRVLDAHAPRKTKVLHGNHKPHVDKDLRKAIMKRSAFKRKASRTKQQEDIIKYKKQRNLVVKHNREMIHYFNNLETSKNLKSFWDKCRPYFSNKHPHGDSKIILIEKEEITTNTNETVENETSLVNNDEIAKTLNKHFSETVEKLNTFEWPSNNEDLTEETLTKIIKKFRNLPSIVKIKSKYLIEEKFSFQPVFVKDVENVIKNIPGKNTSGGDIPIQILTQSGFTYQILTYFINDANNKNVFPDSFKIPNITPAHKKDEPTDNENCRPISVLPLL